MKRFAFNLDTLLDLRCRQENTVKQELAVKQREVSAAHAQIARLTDELAALQKTERASRSDALDVTALGYSVVYRHKLKLDIEKQKLEIDNLTEQASAIRVRLVAATKARRAIEIVRQHRLERWRKDYKRETQDFVDDVSQQGWIRRDAAERMCDTARLPRP